MPYNVVVVNMLVFLLEVNLACTRILSPYNFVIGNTLMVGLEGNIAQIIFPSPLNVIVFVIEINL